MPDPAIAVPTPAATVVVMRPATRGFEVLMLRRHAALEVLAGAYVFPGGRIDPADGLADSAGLCDGLDTLPRIPGLDAAGELAVRVAAIRELVEEAGVLLARRDGDFATAADAVAFRAQLLEGAELPSLLAAGGWRLALDALTPFGRIVTPSATPRRFDTHFLLAPLPDGQEPSHDGTENDDLVWVEPHRAIDDDRPVELSIAPPTWYTLALLASHDSIGAALAWARTRTIDAVEPRLVVDGDLRSVTFPNDSVLADLNGPQGIRLLGDTAQGWRTTRVRDEGPYEGMNLPSNP